MFPRSKHAPVSPVRLSSRFASVKSTNVQFLTRGFAAMFSLWGSDLSRNEPLQTLEVTARSADAALCWFIGQQSTQPVPYILDSRLSCISRSYRLLYQDYDFRGV